MNAYDEMVIRWKEEARENSLSWSAIADLLGSLDPKEEEGVAPMTFTVIITTAPNVSLGCERRHTWKLPTERHMRNLARAISRKPHTSVVYTYDNDGAPHTHMCQSA